MQNFITTIVPEPSELLTIHYYHRLAGATSELRHADGSRISRRDIPFWMADQLFDENLRFEYRDGTPFFVSDTAIDDVFNNDGSFRWLSDLTAFAERPPRQVPQARLVPRLTLLALSFWVAHPEIAAGFAAYECFNQPQCGHWSWDFFERCETCPFAKG